MCQPMPSGYKPETVLELPMSVNKAPIKWRQGRIERCLEPLVYYPTYMPVGKPSLVKGRWEASVKYVLFSHRRNKPKR